MDLTKMKMSLGLYDKIMDIAWSKRICLLNEKKVSNTGRIAKLHNGMWALKKDYPTAVESSVDDLKKMLIRMPNVGKKCLEYFDEILHEIVEKDKSWI